MPRKPGNTAAADGNIGGGAKRPKSLRELAAYLELDPSTVSVVMNDVPGRSISTATRERVKAAAKEFNYRPSLLARSLRQKDTKTVGILLPMVGEEYHAQVLSGIADELERHRYHFLIAQHRHNPQTVREYADLLLSRGVTGFVAIDTHLQCAIEVPVVAVAGHEAIPDVTNVALDHDKAATDTMLHLKRLGHTRIAVIRGQKASSDSSIRWKATVDAANALGITIAKKHTVELLEDAPSPEHGYSVTQQLLERTKDFTAVVCFNDFAALGAIRALGDTGLSVPDDVSVVGFDDIRLSMFARPSITTVRQPLAEMGKTAAQLLLKRIGGIVLPKTTYAVEPLLIVRESTGTAKAGFAKNR